MEREFMRGMRLIGSWQLVDSLEYESIEGGAVLQLFVLAEEKIIVAA